MSSGTLFDLLDASAQRWPDGVALALPNGAAALTYRDLATCAGDLSNQLRRLSLPRALGPGDTVALASDNCVEFVVALFALARTGVATALVDPALAPAELATRARAVRAKAVVVPEHLVARFGDAGPPVWKVGFDERRATIAELGALSSPPEGPPRDAALLMFTAGTTSTPKVVPLTAANLSASVDGIRSIYRLCPDDATLLVMPLFHGHGLIAGLLATLASGGKACLPRGRRFSAHSFWAEIVDERASWFTAVPTILQILLARARDEYPHDCPPRLRFIRSCSAPLAETVKDELEATFRAPVVCAYGMTETAHQATSTPLPDAGVRKRSSVGGPTGVELRILDAAGRALPTGAVGEVGVRGPAVMSGYLENPAANAASFVDGWFRTGDLGRLDDDGSLFLQGRIKEIINRGGEKISPSAIDRVLLANPKIEDALSFGVPDAKYGEEVVAAVVLKPGESATEAELEAFTREQLSAFEVPKHFYFVADFPRTAKGAGDRRELAARFGGGARK